MSAHSSITTQLLQAKPETLFTAFVRATIMSRLLGRQSYAHRVYALIDIVVFAARMWVRNERESTKGFIFFRLHACPSTRRVIL